MSAKALGYSFWGTPFLTKVNLVDVYHVFNYISQRNHNLLQILHDSLTDKEEIYSTQKKLIVH